MDLHAPYRLDPQVSLRPEDFGALAYHFGNRKLSFVKHPDLLRVLESLDTEPTLAEALRSAGVVVSDSPAGMGDAMKQAMTQ